MPLTDRDCKNAKSSIKLYKIADSLGLYLEVAPSGGRYWRMKYRFLDKEKRLAFGVYPETSLAEARDKRDQAKKILSTGIDPAEHKKGQKRDAVLNAATAFIRCLNLNQARLYVPTINAVKLLMLTFVRTSELIGATWNEINLETGEWIIPVERMKMRRPHIVPLAKQAIAILEEQKRMSVYGDWIFPNQVTPRKHMSNCTILGAIKRLGYKGQMTGHGFRALAMSSIKEKLGYRHEVVDRQLAHAPRSKVDAAYSMNF